MEFKPELELDEEKENEKEKENSSNSNYSNNSTDNNTPYAIHKIREPFSLSGGKQPLSLYTRRIIDSSKIINFLSDNSSHGICGSYNLGNTCFMNSSIACLSNCKELTYFFISDDYKKEINTENKSGMRGALATCWANLMKQYWLSDSKVGDPSDLKDTFGHKIKRFSGLSQQDSNEFLDLFLDILNEDLNFVIKKEYIELKEKSDDESEEECSKRFWDNYLKRNDSIITDLFCGQIKSTLTCPDCGYINITFDPFNTLNLNIPQRKNKFYSYNYKEKFDIFYVPKYYLRTPIRVRCRNISKNATFKDWLRNLKNDTNFIYNKNIKNMILTEIECFEFKLIKKYDENSDDIFDNFNDKNYFFSYDIMDENENKYIPIYYKNENKFSVFPRIIMVSETMTTLDDFRKKIFFNLRKLIYSPFKRFMEESDDLTEKIKEYINNYEIKDEYIFKLIDKEYEKIFINKEYNDIKNVISDFLEDMPFELYLIKDNDYQSSEKINIINKYNFTTLSDEFMELTKITSFNEPITKILNLIENENYIIILEFNENSSYINKELFKLNKCKTYKIDYREEKNDDDNDDDITLKKCFQLFEKEEKLKKGDEWYCPKCKNNVLPYKKMELYYTPKILIICFKRFIKDSYFWERNDENISFPINNLDLKEFIVGSDKDHSVYDLFAVSQHYGGTGFGHYTAICENFGKWYCYDDGCVHEVDKTKVNSSAAYVLFYRRKTD